MDTDSKNVIQSQETMMRKLKDEIASMNDVIRAQDKELQALRKLNKKLEEALEFYKTTVDQIFQMAEKEDGV